jgi:site-specific DNA recombinase
VSSAGQRDRHTIASQLEELPRTAAAQGWDLVCGPYVDDGVSGALPGTERPGMRALLEAVEAHRLDVVAVVGWDRLGREEYLHERAEVVGRLQRAGVLVAEGATLIDLQRPEGELYATLMGWAAAQQRRRIRDQTAAGRRRVVAQGRKPAGPVPYGYRYEHATGAWTIDAGEGAVVAEVYRRVIEGDSCGVIAQDLDVRGIHPSRARRDARRTWKPERLLYLVHSPAYRGEYQVDRERGITLPVPPLVDEVTWMAAQRALGARRSRDKRSGEALPFLLRDLLSCGLCGQHVRVLSRPRGSSYYVCRAKVTQGRYGSCAARWWPVDEVDGRVWDRVSDWLAGEEAAVIDAVTADKGAPAAPDDGRVAKALTRLDRAQADTLAQYRRGIITAPVRDAELEAVAKDRRELEAQSERAATAPAPVLDVDQLRAALHGLRMLTGADSFADRRALLSALVPPQGVELGQGRDIHITVNLGALVSAASGSPGRTRCDEHAFAVRLAA